MDLSTLTLFIFSSSLLLFSCAAGENEKSIEEIAKEIDQLIGNAEAESIDQCALMPIGSKPAGGPWGFLVYSKKNTDQEKLENLVEKYNELDAARNEESGGFSTADVATGPQIVIRNGSCFGEGMYAWNPGEVESKT